jgi:ceramide glucosyltransferase
MTAALLLAALLALGLQVVSVALALARRHAPPRADPAVGMPPIALLRPVCGRDPFDAETLGTSFGLDYPHYEVVFCAASAEDPVLPLVRDLIAANPGTEARLLVGDDALSGNPKLNNLVKGWNATAADWVAMTDSNVILPPDYLRQLVGCWSPGTGLVSSPPAGVRPEGLWGRVECAFLNGHQAKWQLAADALGFGFAQGKNLFTTRGLVERSGGLVVLGRDLAEDVACTKMVRRAGLRVRLVRRPFAQPIGRKSKPAVWDRQLRWSRVRWLGFPALFLLEPFSGPALPILALVAEAAFGGAPWALVPAFLMLWYGAEWILLRAMGWPAAPRDLAAAAVRDTLLLPLWLATFAGRGFVWRGTAMAPGGKAAG